MDEKGASNALDQEVDLTRAPTTKEASTESTRA